jgi:cellulose synthase (UDP-forming)
MALPVASLLRSVRPASATGPFGWHRRPAPNSNLPEPESDLRRLYIRGVAVAAILCSLVYLMWRTLFTVDLAVPWASIPLLVLEIHAAVGLVLFTFSLWDVDSRPQPGPIVEGEHRIAVLIPTYNEGAEVLMPTIAAAVAMRLEHETWVLDDGERPEIAELASDLGARYLARTDHSHAKAGNVNNALRHLDVDLVAILDADHVASPDFLVRTLGYFSDPKVALVQTPQDFYNVDSFEHDGTAAERAQFHEQALFYRVIQPGKNRWAGAFWCGTGAVVRLSALRAVGGVATETITEDIHTTIRFHRAGWHTVYHNEVLARGLAASDAETYQAQRLRWGTGAMQLLRRESPLTVPGLTLGQRLTYATTLLGWFDAWRTLGYLLMPVVVVATGVVPIAADPAVFFPAFLVTFGLQQLAMRMLSRGYHRPVLSVIFELVRMTPNLVATLGLFTRRRAPFVVTPKGRTGDGRTAVHAPTLLVWVAALSAVTAGWFLLTISGLTPVRYAVPWAAYAAMVWLIVNAALVGIAIRRVRALRYAHERRASVRFELDIDGELEDEPARVRDLSLTGARVEMRHAVVGTAPMLEVRLGGTAISLRTHVRSYRGEPNEPGVYGLEFAPGQHAALAALALALFATRIVPGASMETVEQGLQVTPAMAA